MAERQWPFHIAILITSFLYAWIGIFVKFIDGAVPPMSIAFYRLVFAIAFLLPAIFILDRQVLHRFRDDWKNHLLLGFLMAISMGTFTAAMVYSSVSTVTVLWASYVFWTAILAYFILNEHLTLRCCLAILFGLAGVVLINPLESGNAFGNFLAFISSITYAVYLVLLRKEEKTHSIGVVFWIVLFAALFLAPFPFIVGVGQLSGMPLLWLALLGILCTGVAYLLLNVGVHELEADVVSIIILIFDTLFSVLLAVFLLGESATPTLIIGGLMIVVAGIIMEACNGHGRYAHHR